MLILWQSLLRTTALLPAVPVAKSSKRDDFLWAGKRCPPNPPSPHHKKSSFTVRGLRLKAPETEREREYLFVQAIAPYEGVQVD